MIGLVLNLLHLKWTWTSELGQACMHAQPCITLHEIVPLLYQEKIVPFYLTN